MLKLACSTLNLITFVIFWGESKGNDSRLEIRSMARPSVGGVFGNFSEVDLDHFWHIDSVPVPECGNGSSCLLPPPPKAAPKYDYYLGDLNLGDIDLNVRDIELTFSVL